MKKVRWLSAAAGTAIVAFSLAMPTAAYAAGPSGDTTGLGNLSLLNGNGINLPVSVPIDLCGVGVGVLGGSSAGCQGGASTNTTIDPAGTSGGTSGGGPAAGGSNGDTSGIGNLSAANGNTVNAPVSVPVSICGVSGAVAGAASSHCTGGSHSSTTITGSGGAGGNNGDTTGVGNLSAVNGNTINAPISAPISACSISLAILGMADSGCTGGASTDSTIVNSGGAGGNNGDTTGVGNLSLVNGNTINAPVSVPVSVCSVSLAVLGEANSTCRGGATTTTTINPPPPTCRDARCAPPTCRGRDCTPPPPTCRGAHCAPPACHSRDCTTPVCHRTHCTPPPRCIGARCTVTPPAGGRHHRHPGGAIPGITTNTSGGSGPNGGSNNAGGGSGTANVTAATTTSMSGNLPTTGADLALVAAAAFGSIAVGTGAVMFARRRRSNQGSPADVSPAA
jgi:hypothetical protein